MHNKKYWFQYKGKENGPYSNVDIESALKPDTLVWELGTPYWKKANEFEWYKPSRFTSLERVIIIFVILGFLIIIPLIIIQILSFDGLFCNNLQLK